MICLFLIAPKKGEFISLFYHHFIIIS